MAVVGSGAESQDSERQELMARVIAKFPTVFVPGQLGQPRDPFFKPLFSPTVNFVFAAKLRASSTPVAVGVETKPVFVSVLLFSSYSWFGC